MTIPIPSNYRPINQELFEVLTPSEMTHRISKWLAVEISSKAKSL